MLRLILLTFTLFTLIACSPQSEVTNAKLKVSIGALAADLTPSQFPGGLILYGKELGGNKFFSRHLSQMQSNEIIPNGQWNFVVIGWDDESADGAMTGKQYCDSINVDLTGGDIEVVLNAQHSKCGLLGPTYNSGGDMHFYQNRLHSCNLLNQTSDVDSCDYDMGATPRKRKKGTALSYRLIAKPYDNFGGPIRFKSGPDFIASDSSGGGCSSVDGAGAGGNLTPDPIINANIPISNNNYPFFFIIRAYLNSTDCDDDRLYKDIVYHSKLFSAGDLANPNLNAKAHSNGTNTHKIFVKTTVADVCGFSNNTYSSGSAVSPYSSGTGSQYLPYIICDGIQLSKIESSDTTSSYMLGRDIDLHPFTALLQAQTVANLLTPNLNTIPCTQNGDNFVPIGGYDDSFSELQNKCNIASGFPLNTAAATGDVFTGNFDGNNFGIKNLRIQAEQFVNVGFIRRLGNNARLVDIEFHNAEITGDSDVGIIGKTEAGANFLIDKVLIKNSRFQARNQTDAHVGALIGNAAGNGATSVIRNIYIEDTIVETDGDKAGGAIGKANNLNIKNTSFDGYLFCTNNANNKCTYLGGIIGDLVDNVNGNSLVSRGVIDSKNGTRLGGIVGGMNGGGTFSIEDIYSKALIISSKTGTNQMIGGLVGNINNASVTINEGFYGGHIIHRCVASAATCAISQTVGASNGTLQDLYTYAPLIDTYQAGNSASTFVATLGTLTASAAPLVNLVSDIKDSTNTPRNTRFNGTGGTGEFNFGDVRWGNITTLNVIPFLGFEKTHPCRSTQGALSVSLQISNGYGQTATNPVYICHAEHFEQMLAITGPKKYFRLGEHINVASNTAGLGSANTITDAQHPINWGHELDGDNKTVFGVINDHGTVGAGVSVGLFNSISNNAEIKNISFLDIQVGNVGGYATTSRYALLVGDNNGLLENITVSGDIIRPTVIENNVGMIAARNYGTITEAETYGQIYAENTIGGIVSKNEANANIIGVSSEVRIVAAAAFPPTLFAIGATALGGIAGENAGYISEVVFDGLVSSDVDTNVDGSHGGIVGINGVNGTIVDANFASNGEVYIGASAATASNIGGLVGDNQGSISRSVASGIVRSKTSGSINFALTSIGGAIGSSSGSVNNVLYFTGNIIQEYNDSANNFTLSCVTDANDDFEIISSAAITASASYFSAGFITNPIIKISGGPDANDFIRLTNSLGDLIAGNNATNNTEDTNSKCLADSNIDYVTAANADYSFYNENILNSVGTKLTSYADYGDKSNYTNFNIVDFNTLSESDLDNLQSFFDLKLTTGDLSNNRPIWELGDNYPYLPKLLRLNTK